jgi:glycosyltransferase involved in cell wall biosynthesis
MSPGATGGGETFARELARALPTEPDISAHVLVAGNVAHFSDVTPETGLDWVKIGPTTGERLRTIATLETHRRLGRQAFNEFDVVHFPVTVGMPRPGLRQGIVQTVHDVQHLDLPSLFSRAERLYRRRYYEGTSRQADIVVADSEFTRKRIIERVGVSPQRVRVAYFGVDHEKYKPRGLERENFVLYPARPWPHKNHAKLIEAVELARQRMPGLRLVLTGGGLDALGTLPSWVERRGLVSEEELIELYQTAAAMVFPSHYEGFGLPVIEAMASGCPVATSGEGSLREVVAGAGVEFDAYDAASIARGVIEAVARSEELATAGTRRAADFTWQQTARAYADAYRDAARIAAARR